MIDFNDPLAVFRSGMATAKHAAERPDKLAVASHWGNRTFAELNGRANQLVRYLREAGLQEGDAVAIVLKNRPEFIEAHQAALRGGWRLTPVNWHLTGEEVGYILDNCEARAVIYDGDLATSEEALSLAPNAVTRIAAGGDLPGCVAYSDAIDGMAADDIENAVRGTQMLYTSGTTGRPKGVYRKPAASPAAQGQAATQTLTAARYDAETDMCLCTGPAYHAAPLAFNVAQPLGAGAGVVLMDKWDAAETLRLIDEYGITHTHMVATMFHRLLHLPDDVRAEFRGDALRFVLHGAAPCPVHVKRAMIEWFGPVIYEYYAATEGGGGFFIDSEEWLKKPGSVGRTPEGADNRILDDDFNELPPGEVGTIYFRAPEGRFEYFKAPEKTSEAYHDTHFTLGDMGYLDEDGYLFLTGRSAETIISGGVNIYPQEVDTELLKHEAVLDVCTIGVPNEEWGEEVKSVVQLKPGYTADTELAEALMAWAHEHLPSFMCPRSIDWADDLPRLPTGKIQRRKVREPYWAGRKKQI